MTMQAALDQHVELEGLFDSHREVSLDTARVSEFLADGYKNPFLLLDLDIVRQNINDLRRQCLVLLPTTL